MWDTVLIVGAGGCTGRAVLKILVEENKAANVVLTSRRGKLAGIPDSTTSTKIEVKPLDMVEGDVDDLTKLCQEVQPDIMFCVLGLAKYHVKAWGPGWPKISDGLLQACKTTQVPLIFMDNLYAFGPEGMARMPLRESDTTFTESGTKTKPQVRAAMTRKFLAASEAGEAKIALVRASDFFGPYAGTGILNLVWSDAVSGNRVTFLGDPTKIHAQTYVPDVARALILVGENPDTWGRAWHTPTQPDMTMLDWLRTILKFNGKPDTKLKYMRADGLLLKVLSWFMEDVDGLRDVVFMWKGDYTVNSDEFMARFPDFKPTPLQDALQGLKDWFDSQDKSSA
mmetsp:Transcript_22024/g.43287  ORF Transcript_22024/g.43287 Transcript_22024/m.43287 type:complete len:339 (+) Transcript_22024:85-1101(+)